MPEPAHDAVGVDPVDADAVLAELGGEQPHLVRLVGLGRAVGDVVRSGEHAVLAADVDDVAAHPLVDHHPCRLPGDEERALGHHVVLEVPVVLGRLEQRLGDRQAGVVDDEVDAAERQHRLGERGADLLGIGDVDGDRHGDVAVADLGRDPLGRLGVDVGDDDARSLGGEAVGDGPADARAGTGDEGDPRRQRLGLGQSLQLGLLERPVLDAELLRLAGSARTSRPTRRRASR